MIHVLNTTLSCLPMSCSTTSLEEVLSDHGVVMRKIYQLVSAQKALNQLLLIPFISKIHHVFASQPLQFPNGRLTWYNAARISIQTHRNARFEPGEQGTQDVSAFSSSLPICVDLHIRLSWTYFHNGRLFSQSFFPHTLSMHS